MSYTFPGFIPRQQRVKCSDSKASSRRQVRRPDPSPPLVPGHWYPKARHRTRHWKVLKKK